MIKTYYIIREKSTGKWLPEVAGTRGGYTHTQPVAHLPPRLFVHSSAAQRALTWWLKGITSVDRFRDSYTLEYDETWRLDEMPERKKENMEVVPVLLKL